MTNYSKLFKINRKGVWLMINGRMFSCYKGENSGKWKFSTWDNIWRKTKTPVGQFDCYSEKTNS